MLRGMDMMHALIEPCSLSVAAGDEAARAKAAQEDGQGLMGLKDDGGRGRKRSGKVVWRIPEAWKWRAGPSDSLAHGCWWVCSHHCNFRPARLVKQFLFYFSFGFTARAQ